MLALATLALVTAGVLVASGWRQPRPSLRSATTHLRRPPATSGGRRSPLARIGAATTTPPLARWISRWHATLRLIDRPPEVHVGILVVAAATGLAGPGVLLGVAAALGATPAGALVPAVVSLLAAVVIPALVHADAASDAAAVHVDLRHQLSAYLDMVTMLLAGNTGHEGAIARAAAAGDGLLFQQLRRRLREVGATGRSGIGALALVAEDYDLDELRQVAATASLSAAEGAPVARTLAAKCATLRSTMAADQEARARVRNDKITPPMVGMALLFMALVIYPALGLG